MHNTCNISETVQNKTTVTMMEYAVAYELSIRTKINDLGSLDDLKFLIRTFAEKMRFTEPTRKI